MIRPGIFFRGMAMGAADVVPGVSGGTLALITGIYEELINTLGGITPRLLTVWRQQGFVAVWQQANLTFLFTLLAGIFTSIAVLARLITWLLDTHPVPVWAFFSGLILASIFLVLKPLQQRGPVQIGVFLLGTGVAVAIGLAPALSAAGSGALVFFFSGMLAICAMILPGISGSFILLLLGMYQPVLEAVKQAEFGLLLAFLSGCAVGLLSFVHVLKWTLHRFHDTVMALLAGFMAGSLLKLWPWRLSGEHGLGDTWLWPSQYAAITDQSAQLPLALTMVAVAAGLVWLLYRVAPVHNVAQTPQG
jgi:putative membrane protein